LFLLFSNAKIRKKAIGKILFFEYFSFSITQELTTSVLQKIIFLCRDEKKISFRRNIFNFSSLLGIKRRKNQ